MFPLPDFYSNSYADSYSDNMQKVATQTGANSDGHSNAKFPRKLLKNHLIGTDIGVKLGTVPICIGIGIRIVSVETVLHIIILAI